MRKARVQKDGENFWFAEVDEDRWIEINREPELGDEQTILDLSNGITDGVRGRTKPMLIATRYFYMYDEPYLISEIGDTC